MRRMRKTDEMDSWRNNKKKRNIKDSDEDAKEKDIS